MNKHVMRDECLAVLLLLASVIVSDAGRLQISQESATKRQNETFFVFCKDSGGSPVTWRGPKGVLGPKTKPTVQVASYGTSLVFNRATLQQSGTYTCSTDNEHKKFHLNVTEPLTFMDTESVQQGEEGKAFTLRCEVQGGKITWSLEGGEGLDPEKYLVGGDGLFIKKLEHSDARTYICKALQPSTGDVQDRRIKLRVLHKPKFPFPTYARQEVAWAYVNGTVNLTCAVVADPPPMFQWLKYKDSSYKSGGVINIANNVSILQLHVDKSSFGNYKCIASNRLGKLEKYFSLEEGVKLSQPDLVDLKAAGSDWVDLEIRGVNESANLKKEMGPMMVNVMYKKVGDTEWYNRDFNITEDDIYRVDNLSSSSRYELMAAMKNLAGLSDYSDILLLQTAAAEPDSGPATLSDSAIVTTFFLALIQLSFW